MDITHKNSRTIRTLLNLASQSIKRFATQNYGYLFFPPQFFFVATCYCYRPLFLGRCFIFDIILWSEILKLRPEQKHDTKLQKIIAKYEGKSGKYSSRLTPLIKVLVFFFSCTKNMKGENESNFLFPVRVAWRLCLVALKIESEFFTFLSRPKVCTTRIRTSKPQARQISS